MNKTLLALILAGLVIVGCDQKASQEPVEQLQSVDTAHNALNSLDWNGTYLGTLPCADCEGVETKLEINFDGTFVLTENYLGKEDSQFVYQGKFNWNAAGNTIAVPSESEEIIQFFVAENQLFRLDDNGQRVSGELAEQYVLKKQ